MSKAKLEYKTLPFQMTSNAVAGEGSAQGRIMEGYASTWSMDLGGDVIEPGAFTKCIQRRFTDEVATHGYGRIRFMSEHKTSIGRILDIRQDEHGLWVKFYFSTTRLGNDICTLVNDHALDQMSIGFVVPAGGSYKDKEGNRHITEIDCQEASVVTFPMNEETDITELKGGSTLFSSNESEPEGSPVDPILSDVKVALNTEEANTLLEHEIKSMAYHLANAALEIKKGKKLSSATTGKLLKVLATVHEVLSSSMAPQDVNEEDNELEEVEEDNKPGVFKDLGGASALRTVFATDNLGNQKPMAVSDPVCKKNSNSNLPNVEGIVDPIAMENPSNPQTSPKMNMTASDESDPAAQKGIDSGVEASELDSNTENFDDITEFLNSAATMLASMR